MGRGTGTRGPGAEPFLPLSAGPRLALVCGPLGLDHRSAPAWPFEVCMVDLGCLFLFFFILVFELEFQLLHQTGGRNGPGLAWADGWVEESKLKGDSRLVPVISRIS